MIVVSLSSLNQFRTFIHKSIETTLLLTQVEPQLTLLPDVLGDTVIDDVEKSVTKEVIERAYFDYGVGAGLTDIQRVVGGGTTDFVIHTSYDHGLNSIARVTITTTGSNYGNNTGAAENLYNAPGEW